MAGVKFEDVHKVYADGTHAVKSIDLEIEDGEFVVLVGPSGCGKTTALRMVAGLEEISHGKVSIGDEVVNDKPPRDRDIAMVFQNYALYPHLTVGENIGFSLELRGVDADEREGKVHDAAEILGIENLLDRAPKELSGGQRQRVAMGRAIVREPQVFLMDEPLSNLDAKLRTQMRSEVLRIQKELGVTAIYVTHDQTEAMTMGDRVAVLRKGELQQVAPPKELYDRPVNLFVAGFIGSPAMNMVLAEFHVDGDGGLVSFGSHELTVPAEVLERRPRLRDHDGGELVLGIRPEDLEDAEVVDDPPDGELMEIEVELVEEMGAELQVHFEVDAPRVLTEDTKELAADVGNEDIDDLDEDENSSWVARFHPRAEVERGSTARMHVDTRRLHAFDPSDGTSIFE